MEGWTAAYHAAEVRSGAARQTAQRLGWAHDRHHLFRRNTIASLLAIVLLALSRLRMGPDTVLFAGGVVAWTLAEYVVHRFVLHGFVPTEHRRRFRCGRASCLCTVFVRAPLRAPRSR